MSSSPTAKDVFSRVMQRPELECEQKDIDVECPVAEDDACVDTFSETSDEILALLPGSSPLRNQKESSLPSTPSSNSSHVASHTSSRYSPASSASRSPPSASSYVPLSPPSSSELRRRRKLEVPPVPFPTFHTGHGSSLDDTVSIQNDDIHKQDTESKVIKSKTNTNGEYNDQQQRLRQLLQQNFFKHQHTEDDHESVNVGSSNSVLSCSQDSHIYTNLEYHHEHEIVINPKSLTGTIESASFHLLGQTGGRVKCENENSELKNAAIMNGFSLHNAMDTDESSMSDDVVKDTAGTSIKIDLENGVNVISANERLLSIKDDHHEDLWSTGIAASVVMGTVSRYHKTFFMFPHGRKVILPIIIGTLAMCLSIVTLRSCRFLTLLQDDSQVFELGPWRYLSPGGIYNGEVCLSYPSDMEVDAPFMFARIVSILATCLGAGLLMLTTTMMCIPYSKSSMSLLSVGYVFAGILQALTMVSKQTNSCKGGGYFHGYQCKPNQDVVFCLAASVLYIACGWVLHMLEKFAIGPPAHLNCQVYTCSAKSNSSDESKGILRTVEKSWTKIPSGETLVATVLVERRKASDGKIKTKHSIQTELI